MPKIFFSYSRADAPMVDRIAKDLSRQGVELWMDRQNLVPGQEWLSQIRQAISEADFMVVFLSQFSLKSKSVQYEYEKAFEYQSRAGGTRLIPVLLDKVDLPSSLAKIQYADFTESYIEGMQQLLRALAVPTGPRPGELFPQGFAKEVASEVAKILGLEPLTVSRPSAVVNPKLVFVIISFRDDMEPIFEGIEEAGKPLGLEVKRVKDVPGDYRITDQVIRMIREARLVVADLTHERPNVYFELGYARGLGKTVITIAREGTLIHFDVKDWTFINYIDSRILERDMRKRFEFELSRDAQ
jgi:TIR domain